MYGIIIYVIEYNLIFSFFKSLSNSIILDLNSVSEALALSALSYSTTKEILKIINKINF